MFLRIRYLRRSKLFTSRSTVFSVFTYTALSRSRVLRSTYYRYYYPSEVLTVSELSTSICSYASRSRQDLMLLISTRDLLFVYLSLAAMTQGVCQIRISYLFRATTIPESSNDNHNRLNRSRPNGQGGTESYREVQRECHNNYWK